MNSYKKYVIEKLTYMSGPRVTLLFSSLLLTFILLICVTANAAWSREMPRVSKTPAFKGMVLQKSLLGPDGSCLPLLNSVSLSTNSGSGPNQRSAGTAAALSLVLGVRYALLPPPQEHGDVKTLHPQAVLKTADLAGATPSHPKAKDRSALSVAAYRQCQKEQALQGLHSYRWER